VDYGNLRNPRRPGVAGLSLAATVLAGISALAGETGFDDLTRARLLRG
jgi:hypothetical protein